jgi:molecular chaperone GrpE
LSAAGHWQHVCIKTFGNLYNMEENKNELNAASETMENETVEKATNDMPAGAEGNGKNMENILSELAEQKDKYLRLFAEFDNFKRRTAKERMELNLTAGKDVIISLLEVLDDCDRAEKQIKNAQAVENHEGTLLVFNKLRSILHQKGLKSMESINTDFDVEKHEAITEIEAGQDFAGKVIDELEKGYYLNDRIIRFAKVVVGK